MVDVLISVPHGNPADDVDAPEIATSLASRLRAVGYDVNLLINDQPRDVLDGNRGESRGTPFRVTLANAMMERPRFLLDLHTFPGTEDFWPSEIVLLHTPGVQSFASYMEILACFSAAESLAEARLHMQLTRTDTLNEAQIASARYCDDVVIQARELGIADDSLVLVEHKRGGDIEMHAAVLCDTLRRLFNNRGCKS